MTSRWSRRAAGRTALDQLVYRSRLIGADPRLALWGGGNTSAKTVEADFRGRRVRALRVKGSGSDLRSAGPKDFPALALDDLEPLFSRDAMDDAEMVGYLNRCLLDPASPRPSIETLLHAFIPAVHVDHTHADAILALTNHPNGRRIVERVFGPSVAWVPYIHPGFRLSLVAGGIARAHPDARGLVLDRHGLVTFGATAEESYRRTIALVSRAERFLARRARGRAPLGGRRYAPLAAGRRREIARRIAPRLRGLLAGGGLPVLNFDDSPPALAYVNARAVPRLVGAGPATPDHVLHLKPWPLLAPAPGAGGWPALEAGLRRALASYAARYAAYVRRHAPAGAVVDPPVPRVVLVPRVGIFTTGKDPRAARIAMDLTRRNIAVQTLAFPLGRYATISRRQLCAFEYWPNERYKLSLLPPERPFARRVALVTGAAGGIGLACAQALAREGAQVALADVDGRAAAREAARIEERFGPGRARGLTVDVTSERSVKAGFERVVDAWGGLDLVVSNAGVAHAAAIDALELEDWRRNVEVNATGHLLVARETVRLLKAQGLGGAMVFVGTKNVPAPGAGFGAYSATKAAEVQLARILALEGGPHGIRVNVVNPDAVFRGSRLWSPATLRGRARAHGIPVAKVEDFYAGRSLLKRPVLPEDVAEATLFLLSEKAGKTTGAQLPVDSGVPAAFPR